jgi:hypothetical protein
VSARHRRADQGGFVLFDVHYADGSRSSNRKVPSEVVAGLDGDAPARDLIEEQDREIAQVSGRPPRVIVSVLRSGAKPAGAKHSGAKQRSSRSR